MIEVKVPEEEKRCYFCKDEVNVDILNGDVLVGSAKMFSCEVYLEDEQLALLVSDANGSTIIGVKRIINYCPMCGRKINAIK